LFNQNSTFCINKRLNNLILINKTKTIIPRINIIIMSKEYNIATSEETYRKISEISKSLNISIQKLVELAFHELFELVLSDPSIFLEKVGIIDNIRGIISKS